MNVANANRQRKAWQIARLLCLVNKSMLFDPDFIRVEQSTRKLVAKQVGVTSDRDISDHTWKLAVAHARQIAKKG